MHGQELELPAQDEMPRNGYAVQCRITTEDPENKFTPDYGRILTYRSAGGFGIRLDGGMGYAGQRHHAVLRFAAGEGDGVGPDFRARAATHGPRVAGIPHPRREDEHSVSRKRHSQSETFRSGARHDHAD